MSSDKLDRLAKAPLQEILDLLLRQLEGALRQRDPTHDTSAWRDLITALEAGERPECVTRLAVVLIALVEDKLKTLRDRFSADFAGSLAADITQFTDWESTADFLSIAEEKAQAEQDIVIASALLVACGRSEYASYLIEVIEDDAGALDVDAVIARRLLLHAGAIDGTNTDAPSQARAWLVNRSHR